MNAFPFPPPTHEDELCGWDYSYNFLLQVSRAASSFDEEESVSMEQVEYVLNALKQHLSYEHIWRPIATAPLSGRILLWYQGLYKYPQIGWWNNADQRFECDIDKGKKASEPTHWAPLLGKPERF